MQSRRRGTHRMKRPESATSPTMVQDALSKTDEEDTVTGVTAGQSGLSAYAEAVLRQNGIKSCRTRWAGTDVLSIEVDPTRLEKAQSLLPIIQQRAGRAVHVELHQPTSQPATVRTVADPFAE
jgi:hypothetical protein